MIKTHSALHQSKSFHQITRHIVLHKHTYSVIFVTLLAFLIRFAYIDTLPAELFGDVIEHMKTVEHIVNGTLHNWNYWYGADGPIHPWMVSMLSLAGGNTFAVHKLASIVWSTLAIPTTYLFVSTLLRSRKLGVYASLCMSVWYWNITLSHQAKPHIYTPLFFTLFLWLFLKGKKLMAGFVGGLGLYSQASGWGIIGLLFYAPTTFMGGLLIGSKLLYDTVWGNNSPMSRNSYIGQKFSEDGGVWVIAQKVLTNIMVFFRGIFVLGDQTMRINIPGLPLLDEISYVLFAIGIIYLAILTIRRRFSLQRVLFFICIPMFLAIGPAMADTSIMLMHPNMGRTAAYMPFAALFAAVGIKAVENVLPSWKYIRQTVPITIFIVMTVLNLYRYWFVYPQFLPDKNVPFGKLIAQEMNKYPLDGYKKYQVDCCWGGLGQPEPGAINFVARDRNSVPFTPSSTIERPENICTQGIFNRDKNVFEKLVKGTKYIFVTRPGVVITESPTCIKGMWSYIIPGHPQVGTFILFEAQ